MTETTTEIHDDAPSDYPYEGRYPILNFFHITYHRKDVCQGLANPATRQETFVKLKITDSNEQDALLPRATNGPIPESAWKLLRDEIGDIKPDGAW